MTGDGDEDGDGMKAEVKAEVKMRGQGEKARREQSRWVEEVQRHRGRLCLLFPRPFFSQRRDRRRRKPLSYLHTRPQGGSF